MHASLIFPVCLPLLCHPHAVPYRPVPSMLLRSLLLQRVAPGAASAAEFAQGTIIEIEERLPGEDYDPWQAITVLWDDEWSHLNLKSKVGTDLGLLTQGV